MDEANPEASTSSTARSSFKQSRIVIAMVMSYFMIGTSSAAIEFNLNGSLSGLKFLFHEIEPDASQNLSAFIESRKFILETHRVLTEDNYIITLHRIVNPLVPKGLRETLKPVLLQHGLFASSFEFVLNSDRNNERPRFDARDLTRQPRDIPRKRRESLWSRLADRISDLVQPIWSNLSEDDIDSGNQNKPSNSLSFELANQGYDVWMGNSRGSTYSLNHTHYDYRHDWRYWDFSFHEMGLYDLPAAIDYILEKRARKSLAYVGHSQGNLVMFILQSLQPEWAAKVKPFIALSPVALIPDIYFGAAQSLLKFIEGTLITLTDANRMVKGQLLPGSPTLKRLGAFLCVPKWSTPLCNIVIGFLTGDSITRRNSTLTPIFLQHVPEGTSVLNVLHFGQLIATGEFKSFDFGPEENRRRYGSLDNPPYLLENIASLDIAFMSGRTDKLATVKNVELTRSALRVPLMDDYTIPRPTFGHLDFSSAPDAGELVNTRIVGLIDRYRRVD